MLFGTDAWRAQPYARYMNDDRNDDSEKRQARLDAMLEEFQAARQRRLVKTGIALWNRTEARQQAMACVAPAPHEKVN